jgi:hypothetical protein
MKQKVLKKWKLRLKLKVQKYWRGNKWRILKKNYMICQMRSFSKL